MAVAAAVTPYLLRCIFKQNQENELLYSQVTVPNEFIRLTTGSNFPFLIITLPLKIRCCYIQQQHWIDDTNNPELESLKQSPQFNQTQFEECITRATIALKYRTKALGYFGIFVLMILVIFFVLIALHIDSAIILGPLLGFLFLCLISFIVYGKLEHEKRVKSFYQTLHKIRHEYLDEIPLNNSPPLLWCFDLNSWSEREQRIHPNCIIIFTLSASVSEESKEWFNNFLLGIRTTMSREENTKTPNSSSEMIEVKTVESSSSAIQR